MDSSLERIGTRVGVENVNSSFHSRKDRHQCSCCQRKNESIVINNDIVITVVEIRGDKVRLGI